MKKKTTVDRIFGKRAALAALTAIVIAATALRLYVLGLETLSFDEVVYAYHSAGEYVRGNFIYNFYGFDTPPLGKYVYALEYAAFGLNEFFLRLAPALFGIITVPVTYFVSRKFYNDRYKAVFASSIAAFSIIHIQLSRMAVMEAIVAPFYALSIYFAFEFANKRSSKSWLFLALSVALGMLVKYVVLYAIVTIVVYFLYKKVIRLRKKLDVSVSMDRDFGKAILAAVIIFFIMWPFALYPLGTNVNVSVSGNGQHGGTLSLGVPLILLTFGNVGSFTAGERTGMNFAADYLTTLPLVGYVVFFLVKENIVFVILAAAGLYAAYKRRSEADKLVVLSILIFFLLLSLQRYGYTYRYITVIVPLLAMLAAGSLDLLKKNSYKIAAILIASIFMASVAILYSPSYAFHYNQLNNVFGITDPEAYYSEGTRAALNATADCQNVYTNYDYTTQPYLGSRLVNSTSVRPLCIIVGHANTPGKDDIVNYANTNCTQSAEIEKYGVKLFEVYECS